MSLAYLLIVSSVVGAGVVWGGMAAIALVDLVAVCLAYLVRKCDS
jgi:hypothetical protein